MKIIGRSDTVTFPKLKIGEVRVKIDTGADSSSIHATRIRLKQVNGEEVLSCWLAGQGPFLFSEFEKRKVKSSNGTSENRFAVKIQLRLGEKNYRTTFTLTNRIKMRYPILLGKKFLRGRFIVDVSQKNIYHQQVV